MLAHCTGLFRVHAALKINNRGEAGPALSRKSAGKFPFVLYDVYGCINGCHIEVNINHNYGNTENCQYQFCFKGCSKVSCVHQMQATHTYLDELVPSSRHKLPAKYIHAVHSSRPAPIQLPDLRAIIGLPVTYLPVRA